MMNNSDSDKDSDELSSVSSAGSLETEEDLRYVAILDEAEAAIKAIEEKPHKFNMTASNQTNEHEFKMSEDIFQLQSARTKA